MLIFVMVFSLAACGAKDDTEATEAKADDSTQAATETTESAGKTVLNVWSFTDEVPKMIDKYLELHPDFAAKYEIKTYIS